jgi:ATP-dependent helicase/nuclease subunit A
MTTLPLFESALPETEADADAPPGAPDLTPEQLEAVARRAEPLFVHAGAGSGKTSVLVERFVRAVVEDGVPVDRILAITFTERAAAELRVRVRERLLAAEEREAARACERGWVSTIHGFCSRLLRTHAVAAGLDPEFTVLDEHASERLAAEAFEAALEDFVGRPPDGARVELLAAYETGRVERAVRALHARLRAWGERRSALPSAAAPRERDVARTHERLHEAARAAHAVLRDAGSPDAQASAAIGVLERCLCACEGVAAGATLEPHDLRALSVRRGNAKALRAPAFDELEAAHAACLRVCANRRATADLELFGELLDAHRRRYAELKEGRSALDFDDLELLARDLLERRPALREHLRARFGHVLVDELQDTNRLQSELLELVSDGNLFTVGDELQSIYGFRGAEVEVFEHRRAAAAPAGREVRLSTTFRSPREIADALNAAFAPLIGDGFAGLSAARKAGGGEPLVELLAVDRHNARWAEATGGADAPFGDAMKGLPPWRAAEARALAVRVAELVERGDFQPREVAVLVPSWRDVARYERALSERGLATYVAGGGGLWAAREVADLRAYLALLANPHDEEALVSAWCSPLVGASADALALLGLAARGGRGLWPTLAAAFDAVEEHASGREHGRELREVLPAPDRAALAAFVRRFATDREAAPRLSLPALIERIVSASGFDQAVLATPHGERRLANVRKLGRLAREHEAAEGRDLRGFLDALDWRARAAAREGEAPLEGEDVAAVRLMSVHAAKGLEFPLVCVADLGRGDPCESLPLRVADDGRVGLRLPDPGGGPGIEALEAATLEEEDERAREREERRLMWVAATRAERRLIVSGALDLERPGRGAPMDWLAPALVPELREAIAAGERSGTSTREWEGRAARVAWRAVAPGSLDEDLPEADRTPTKAVEVQAAAVARPPAASRSAVARPGGPAAPVVAPPAPVPVPSRISYSALEAHRRCGYRFYLERVLDLPTDANDLIATPAFEGAGDALSGRTRGSVVHELFEGLDFRRPCSPSPNEVAARIAAHGAVPSSPEVERVRRLVAGFLDTPLRARIGRARSLRAELPFAFALPAPQGAELDGRPVLVEGVFDAHCREGDGALVVDYKTDAVEAATDLEDLCRRDYLTQRLVYALAALRAGAEHVEVVHVFLERPHEPVAVRHEAPEATGLERRLAALLEHLLAARYRPADAPGIELCAGCPGRAALCSWPRERTGSPRASEPGHAAPIAA